MNSENDKMISIIVPVYNVFSYLKKCVDSIIEQTYNNIEIILVDDGSTDGSENLCDEFSRIDDRVVVIHQENNGVSSARNRGLIQSKGHYLAFVDSDDWIAPDMCEKTIKIMEKDKCDIVFFGYSKVINGVIDNSDFFAQQKCINSDDALYLSFFPYCLKGFYTSVWNKVYTRRSLLIDGNLLQFETGVSMGEDERWIIQVINNCKKISIDSTQYYYYTIRRQNSATAQAASINLKHRIDEVNTHYFTYDYCIRNNKSDVIVNYAAYRVYLYAYLLLKSVEIDSKDRIHLLRIASKSEKSYIKSHIDTPTSFMKKKLIYLMFRFNIPFSFIHRLDLFFSK